MAINTLECAKVFQTGLDKQILQEATSNFLEANAGQVKYTGGDTVKIPVISMDGLGDYDRDNGYAQGSVTLAYQDFKMTQDRGRKFQLDAMDVDASNFIATAGTVMGEFQRVKVIPEIDSYRWSKIYSLTNTANKLEYTPTKSDIMDKLDVQLTAIKDIAGNTNDLVIVMATPVQTILNNAIDKKLDVINFTAGQIHTEVKGYNSIPIITVSSARMKTLYTKYDGKTSGQEAGGLVAAEGAKQINWLIFPKRAPIAVSKTDTMRIFDPQTNQDANAWRMDYRKFHDLWIPQKRLDTVFASTQP
jgi:hypothetical protein